MSARAVVLVAVLLLGPHPGPASARGASAAPAGSASPSDVSLVPMGRAGGMAWSVAAAGNLVHVGAVHDGGPRVATWDVADPAAPVLRAVSHVQPGRIAALALDGDVAYLAEGGSDGPWSPPWPYSGLVTVDGGPGPCRRPDTALPLDDAFVTDMAVADGYAYVTESFGRMGVFSLAEPFAPRSAWRWRNWFGGTSGGARGDGCAAAAGAMVLVGYGDRLYAVEAAGPSRAPTTVGSIAGPATHIREIAVDGSLAYVVGWPGWLWIVDVSVPEVPLEVARIAMPLVDFASIEVSGGVAIAVGHRIHPGADWGPPTTNGPGLVVAFDVGDPVRPRVADLLDVTGTPLDLSLAEDLACIAAGSGGLLLVRVDVSFPGPRPTARPTEAPAARRTTAWLPFASARAGLPRGLAAPVDDYRQEGGAVTALATSGDRLYAGIGARLAVLEVDDANTPAVAGSTALLARPVTGIAIAGDFAYALVGDRALATISVADPAAPALIGVQPLAAASRRLATDGRVLCVAQGASGLRLFDLSDPAAPRPAGRLASAGRADDVVAAAGHAYVADSRSGVRVVSVQDPDRPQQVAQSRLLEPDAEPFACASVALAGTRLYFAAATAIDVAGVAALLDVSRPAEPTVLGEAATSGRSGCGVAGAGTGLVSWSGADFVRIDVSDAARPRQVGAGRLPVSRWVTSYGDVAVLPASDEAAAPVTSGSWPAWVADGVEGLVLADLADAAAPIVLGRVRAPTVGAVAAVGGLVLAASAGSDLSIYEAPEEGGAPRAMARLPLERPITAILPRADGNVAYVALGAAAPSAGGALAEIDLTDPAAPREQRRFESSWPVLDAAVAGEYAYLAEPGGVRIVSLGAGGLPPRDVTRIVLGHPTAVAAEGSRLYVLSRYAGLWVYDLSRPAEPRPLGFVATPGTDLVVADGTAWVAVGDAADGAPGAGPGLQAVDVSVPEAARLTAVLDLAALRLATGPGGVVIAAVGSNLVRLDVSDPARARLLGRWRLPAAADGLAADRDAWVGAGAAGLLALEREPSGP